MITTHHGPQLAQDAFFLPIPTNAAQYARASSGSLRRAVEIQIETLIAFLDFLDGDPDREATTAPDDREDDGTDDEPALGWAEAETLQDVSSHVGGFGFVDGELDRCDDEDSHDLEAVQ